MDVVYYVRPGQRNDELRYSLRSLDNLPHERVWVVGFKPSWLQGVEFIPGNRRARPQANAVDNLLLASEHIEADEFVIFNDDFYVMEPIEVVPSWHQGPLRERIVTARGAYQNHLRAALAALAHLVEPLAWTLHIPFVANRARLVEILAPLLNAKLMPEWRTMYGNLSGATGERRDDVKVRRREKVPAGPFLSSSDGTFRWLQPLLSRRFPMPSPYEVAR